MLYEILIFLSWAILWYLVFMSVAYSFLLLASLSDIVHRFKENEVGNITSLLKSKALPPVTAIIVAYNEEKRGMLHDSIYSTLKNTYPNKQIIVVNNGSTDQTLKLLSNEFDLQKVPTLIHRQIPIRGEIKGIYISKKYPNVTVIDKTDKDKSDGLNTALNACQTPLFITQDADTILEPQSISRVIYTMLTQPHTVVVGGAIYILNGCGHKDGVLSRPHLSSKPLYILQACEYLRSFMFGRAGWNRLGGSLSYAGAFTLFETHAAIDAQGFQLDNFSNDLEIIVHIQATKYEKKYPYVICYTPAAPAWTDVPGTLAAYWRQRYNWQYGSLVSVFNYKRMFFNPKYKIAGLFSYPFYLFGEIFGAVVEFLAYTTVFISWYLGILDTYWAILLFLICWGFITFLTIATTSLSLMTFNKYGKMNDILLILVYSAVEQFGFRQFSMICRLYATIRFFIDRLFYRIKSLFKKSEPSKA